jgi:hypothetical protein
MFDGDDKVRAAVCKVHAHLDYETALHYVSAEQLKRLADRMLDTKVQLARRLVEQDMYSDVARYSACCKE